MRVILIGFMGVGKTSVGKRLAKKLNFDFIDTDYEIELVEKKSISKIFEQDGEKYFRKLENNLLKDLVKNDNIVISTGGGIITTKENFDILKHEKNVIFLDGSIKRSEEHTSELQSRVDLACRLLREKTNTPKAKRHHSTAAAM